MGFDIILRDIIDEIKNAKFYSQLVDEMTYHNKEEPAICLKFAEKNKNISEAFVGFLPLD